MGIQVSGFSGFERKSDGGLFQRGVLTGRLSRRTFHEQFEAAGCRVVAEQLTAVEIEIPAM